VLAGFASAKFGSTEGMVETLAEENSAAALLPACSTKRFLQLDLTVDDAKHYGRLNNQLISLRNSIYLAHLLRRTFVLPDRAALNCCQSGRLPALVNRLFAFYINSSDLLSDPRFCLIPQSSPQLSSTDGIDLLMINHHHSFWFAPDCLFMRELDAKLLKPTKIVQALLERFISQNFEGQNFTAVHLRGKMIGCDNVAEDSHQRSRVLKTQRDKFGTEQPIFLMSDYHCAAATQEYLDAGASMLLPNASLMGPLTKNERQKVSEYIKKDYENLKQFDKAPKIEFTGSVGHIFLEMLVASHARLFLGTAGSTVSTLVHHMRSARGIKPAHANNRVEAEEYGLCFEGPLECVDDVSAAVDSTECESACQQPYGMRNTCSAADACHKYNNNFLAMQARLAATGSVTAAKLENGKARCLLGTRPILLYAKPGLKLACACTKLLAWQGTARWVVAAPSLQTGGWVEQPATLHDKQTAKADAPSQFLAKKRVVLSYTAPSGEEVEEEYFERKLTWFPDKPGFWGHIS
jgi:hypothetical protein